MMKNFKQKENKKKTTAAKMPGGVECEELDGREEKRITLDDRKQIKKKGK